MASLPSSAGTPSRRRAWTLLAVSLAVFLRAGDPGVLDAGDGQTWVPLSTFTVAMGQTDIRLELRFHGVRTLGSGRILHPGAPLDGHGLPGPAPGDPEGEADAWIGPLLRKLNLEPTVSSEQAQGIVERDLGGPASFLSVETVLRPRYLRSRPLDRKPEHLDAAAFYQRLVGFQLAYLLRVQKGSSEALEYLVDAHRGRILEVSEGTGGSCTFLAPAVPGTCHVRVTSPGPGHRSAVATVTVVDGVAGP
jgi:hypothetical protein